MFPIGDDNRDRLHRPVVTWLLIAANVAVFLYMLTLRGAARRTSSSTTERHPGALRPLRRLPVGESADHLAALSDARHVDVPARRLAAHRRQHALPWVFGDNVEDALGPGRFLVSTSSAASRGTSRISTSTRVRSPRRSARAGRLRACSAVTSSCGRAGECGM